MVKVSLPPPIWIYPKLGFIFASLLSQLSEEEENEETSRDLVSEALLLILDSAFVIAGEKEMPVSMYFNDNEPHLSLLKSVNDQCERVQSLYFD